MAVYNEDLTVLINCLATTFGDEVGQAVQEKFDQLLALENTDINALSAQIATLNALLSSNTEGDVLTAQSILSQLAALDSRLDVLEGSTALAALQATVAALQVSVAGDVASLSDADAALQSNINTIQTALDALAQQVTTIQNNTSGQPECDCVALTAAIADQATAIANLQASDAAQGTQIAALQAAVAALSTNAASIAAAQAAATQAIADAAAAQATATAAQVAATAAALAAATAQAAADAATGNANGANVSITNLKLEIQNINCATVGVAFRGAMRARMFGPAA
jgi:chromosome segregation ATPase